MGSPGFCHHCRKLVRDVSTVASPRISHIQFCSCIFFLIQQEFMFLRCECPEPSWLAFPVSTGFLLRALPCPRSPLTGCVDISVHSMALASLQPHFWSACWMITFVLCVCLSVMPREGSNQLVEAQCALWTAGSCL